MARFAHVKDGIVDYVLSIERDVLEQSNGWYCPSCGDFRPFSEWVQTSYNTKKGTYKGEQVVKDALEREKTHAVGPTLTVEETKKIGSSEDMLARKRKNFAGIGYSYDVGRDAFIPPKPYKSWVLDEETCLWIPPVPPPPSTIDDRYEWNEELSEWVNLK
jgi:hypothetical protein